MDLKYFENVGISISKREIENLEKSALSEKKYNDCGSLASSATVERPSHKIPEN